MSPGILALHPDFIVASKPANISFHGEGGEASFIDQIRQLSGLPELHPVHRLDRITSGLILFARHPEAARQFSELFAKGQMEKCYLALSTSPPSKKQGAIKGGMVKGRQGNWRLTRNEGSLALTQFFSYGLLGDDLPPGLRLFVVRPRTGRTHQIRVALKSLGSPILGDSRYGGAAADRGYLHAWALRFPWQGEAMDFVQSPEEGRFYLASPCQQKLADIASPWQLPWPGSQ